MIGDDLLAALREAEGFSAVPYLCPAGRWTNGYGNTHGVTADSPPVSRDEAEAALRAEATKMEAAVLKVCPMLIGEPQARVDAMVDFAYNFGPNKVVGTTLAKRIAERDWQGAAAQLRRWVYATVDGKPQRLPGLVTRRERAARWMATGRYA